MLQLCRTDLAGGGCSLVLLDGSELTSLSADGFFYLRAPVGWSPGGS